MFIKGTVISGMMFGIEYLWDDNILVIDLLIIRIFVGKFKVTK